MCPIRVTVAIALFPRDVHAHSNINLSGDAHSEARVEDGPLVEGKFEQKKYLSQTYFEVFKSTQMYTDYRCHLHLARWLTFFTNISYNKLCGERMVKIFVITNCVEKSIGSIVTTGRPLYAPGPARYWLEM